MVNIRELIRKEKLSPKKSGQAKMEAQENPLDVHTLSMKMYARIFLDTGGSVVPLVTEDREMVCTTSISTSIKPRLF